jgi:hypothetical protein
VVIFKKLILIILPGSVPSALGGWILHREEYRAYPSFKRIRETPVEAHNLVRLQ